MSYENINEILKKNSNSRYNYILSCGLNDLKRNENFREYRISDSNNGVIFKATIDDTNMFYSIGEINDNDINWILRFAGKGELYCEFAHEDLISSFRSNRLSRLSKVRFYNLELIKKSHQRYDFCQLLTEKDFQEIETFMNSHYNGTSYVKRLLSYPFFGIRKNNHLVATGGIVFLDQELKSCQIGSFLTHPDYRRSGYCSKILSHLLNELNSMGIREVRLDVYEENISACKTYETFGFTVEKKGLETLIAANIKCD